jgi:hypothetical protein
MVLRPGRNGKSRRRKPCWNKYTYLRRDGHPQLCVFITAVPITKLFAWGEGDTRGHVLRETTSRSLCGLVYHALVCDGGRSADRRHRHTSKLSSTLRVRSICTCEMRGDAYRGSHAWVCWESACCSTRGGREGRPSPAIDGDAARDFRGDGERDACPVCAGSIGYNPLISASMGESHIGRPRPGPE